MNARKRVVLAVLGLGLLVFAVGWYAGSRPSKPVSIASFEERLDHFLRVMNQATTPTAEELAEAISVFQIGEKLVRYQRVIDQAHDKIINGKRRSYVFYPGRKKGDEGDYGVWIECKGEPPTIHDVSYGMIVS